MTSPIKDCWQSDDGQVTLLLGDCLEILPTLETGGVDTVVTDPPYGMNKADWDASIPKWLPASPAVPTACFCGVIGMRDYPIPDWVGAWVRQGSTQRNGKLRGFNNWEPVLFYHIEKLRNDVISCPNDGGVTKHPTEKPLRLMMRLIELLGGVSVGDWFMGSGTTGVACIQTGRRFTGIELDREYWQISVDRCKREIKLDKSSFQIRPKPRPAPVGFFTKEK